MLPPSSPPAKSYLEANGIDQDQQDARNVDVDTEKGPADVEPVLPGRFPQLGKVDRAEGSRAPVAQGGVVGQRVALKVGSIERRVNRDRDDHRDSDDVHPLLCLFFGGCLAARGGNDAEPDDLFTISIDHSAKQCQFC